MSRSVAELEDLGLVERTADAADGRIKLITVTAEAKSRLETRAAALRGPPRR